MAEKRQARYALTSAQRAELSDAFACFDKEGSGAIEIGDLRVLLRSLGFELSMDELHEEVLGLEPEFDGFVGLDTFLEIVPARFLEREPEEQMEKAFQLFNPSSNGTITVEHLRAVAEEIGADVSEEDLQAMISCFDPSQDGTIDEAAFVEIMKRSTLA